MKKSESRTHCIWRYVDLNMNHGKTKQISCRLDEQTLANLDAVTEASGRTRTDELKAASRLYLALINLASLRIGRSGLAVTDSRYFVGEDYRLKREALDALAPALPPEVFEVWSQQRVIPLQDSGQTLEHLLSWILSLGGPDACEAQEMEEVPSDV